MHEHVSTGGANDNNVESEVSRDPMRGISVYANST